MSDSKDLFVYTRQGRMRSILNGDGVEVDSTLPSDGLGCNTLFEARSSGLPFSKHTTYFPLGAASSLKRVQETIQNLKKAEQWLLAAARNELAELEEHSWN